MVEIRHGMSYDEIRDGCNIPDRIDNLHGVSDYIVLPRSRSKIRRHRDHHHHDRCIMSARDIVTPVAKVSSRLAFS